MNTSKNNQTGTVQRAVVFATSGEPHDGFSDDRPLYLMPLAGRPALQHALEVAVRAGVESADVIVSDNVEQIQTLLGDGTRWGIQIIIHRVSDPLYPYGVLQKTTSTEDRLLMLHADFFPGNLEGIMGAVVTNRSVFVHQEQWTGAAVVTSEQIQLLDRLACCTREQLSDQLLDQAETKIETTRPISVTSGADLLTSQKRLLNGEFPDLMQHLRTAEPGVWIGRNTRIHPTAVITAPVLIGADCEIARAVNLGPNVVVGDGSFLDRDVSAQDSLVMPQSGVGESLDLRDVVVSGRRLFNARFGATIDIRDDVLVGDLASRSVRDAVAAGLSRTAGALLMLIIWPPLAIAFGILKLCRKDSRQERYSAVQTPARTNELLWESWTLRRLTTGREWQHEQPGAGAVWRDFFARVVPGLSAVVKGKIRLVGTGLRSAETLNSVPDHWKSILLDEPSGLITEALVQFGPDADEDQRCTADVFYAVSKIRFRRLKLLLKYTQTLCLGPVATRQAAGGVSDVNNSVQTHAGTPARQTIRPTTRQSSHETLEV